MAFGAAVSAWYGRMRLPFQDEGGTITLAARILRGEVFYRDLDAYALPGAPYLLAAIMRGFGEDLFVARALAGAFFCAMLLALYAIALRVVDRRAAALFAFSLLGLKYLAWPMGTSYVHGDVSLAFAFVSVALLLHGIRGELVRLPRVAAAGGVAALALLCKQNVGIYLLLASGALLLAPALLTGRPRPRRAPLLALAAGAALPLGAAVLAFAASGTLGAMLASAFVRPFTGYLTTSAVPFLPMLAWWELGSVRGNEAASYIPPELWELLMLDRLPGFVSDEVAWTLFESLSRALYTAPPLALLLAFVARLRVRGTASEAQSALLALAWLGLAISLSAFPRADVLHVLPVLPPLLLVLYALWRRAAGSRFARLEVGCAAVFLALCTLGAGSAGAYRTHRIELSRAKVWVLPRSAWNERLVQRIEQEVPPGGPLFVYGQEAWLYHLSGRFSPWPFVWLYPGMEGGDGGRALRERLERDPPPIVVRGLPVLPGLPHLRSYTREVDAFLRERYQVKERFFDGVPGGAPPSYVVRVLRLRPSAGKRADRADRPGVGVNQPGDLKPGPRTADPPPGG